MNGLILKTISDEEKKGIEIKWINFFMDLMSGEDFERIICEVMSMQAAVEDIFGCSTFPYDLNNKIHVERKKLGERFVEIVDETWK